MTTLSTIGAFFKRQISRFLHSGEVAESRALYIAAWALLFGWFLEFSFWSQYSDFTRNAVEEGRQLCWPFFQSCGSWYFLTVPPLGNLQGAAYALLFALMVWAGFLLVRRRFEAVYAIFLILFAWETLVMLMSMRLSVNYWYFHFLYAALFLFARYKLSFLRVGAVLLYFLSGLTKLNEGWLSGAYFKALQGGLDFIPHALIPVATNAVIFMELVLVWFLFYPDRRVRLFVLGVLAVFHTYSAVFVGLRYPAIVLPMILALFFAGEQAPWSWRPLRQIFGGVLILLLVCAVDAIPYAIPGPSRVTGEGNKLGVYMFDANYQCVSVSTTYFKNGTREVATSTSTYAIQRCDPYAIWFYLKQLCALNPAISSIALTFDTSINGSPFWRIVDVPNACAVSYLPFAHNAWIRIPGVDQVVQMGLPQKNLYRPL